MQKTKKLKPDKARFEINFKQFSYPIPLCIEHRLHCRALHIADVQ